MSIRDSPFLSLGVVDSALRAVHDPHERVQLLGARVHLLQAELDAATASRPAQGGASVHPSSKDTASAPGASSHAAAALATATATASAQAPTAPVAAPAPSPLPLLSARLDLADARLRLHPPNVHAAEAECRVVEDTCKRLMKRAKRLARAAGGAGAGVGDIQDSAGVNGVGQRGLEAPAVTSAPPASFSAEASASEEAEAWLADVRPLRARAQRTLVRVEEALGRPGRAHRARALADELDQPIPDMVS